MAYIDNVTNILQIQPDGLPTFVRLSQNENGRNLYFQLAGNEIDIPANATITISGTKPDGTVYSGTGSISDNVILIPEMIQMTAVAGYWDAKVKIISGGNTIATGRIRFVIDADTVDPDSVPSDSELEGLVAEAQQYAETARTEAYGSPLTATTAAGMTDHTRVYVYTGSETGYTAGHWYYWDGTQWADGGIYNSTATNTDPTLTLAGVPADAKATGDELTGLREDLRDVEDNAVIEEISDKVYGHDVKPKKITFYPNEYTEGISAKYAGSKNLFDGWCDSGESGGITRTINGRFVNVEGTGTGVFQFFNTNNAARMATLAGKTINIYVYIKKTTAWENSSYFAVRVNNATTIVRKNFSVDSETLIGWTKIENVEMPSELTQLRIYFNSLSGSIFSSGDWYWCGAFEALAVDTEHAVAADEEYVCIPEVEVPYVDTMLHESIVESITPTKKYVDNHVPDIKKFWTENIYALPEYFGANGDGITDDSSAIADCLAWAKQNNKAVKGYGRYKITQPIVLDGQYMDVFFKEITYSGNQYAVLIGNQDIRFEFFRIVSESVGIQFGKKTASPVKYGRRCRVYGNEINTNGDCIYAEKGTLYNTCEIRYLYSWNGNCITFDTDPENDMFQAGEYVFRSSSCGCPNGYVGHNINASKLYDFTIEGNCKYGLLNPRACVCIGFRHREQLDSYCRSIINGDDNVGPFLIWTISPNYGAYGFSYISADGFNPWSIDMTEIQGYEPIGDIPNKTDVWNTLAYNGKFMETPIHNTGMFPSTKLAYMPIAEKVYFIGNNKVFEPNGRKTIIISDEVHDFRVCEQQDAESILKATNLEWGTDFIIDANTTIYFNASFGAIGYNDLTITQRDGHTCIIYDKLGSVLFDGTNEGDGKWRLRCIIDKESGGRFGSYTGNWWCYDGTNELWEIEKIE